MVQTAPTLLSRALSPLLAHAVTLLVGGAVVFLALLLFAVFGRGRFHDALCRVGRRCTFLGQWALVLLL